ncbi:hypothetical protein COY27_05450 [Candidatus Woesearchaeota archaeon CG_4_10_14_0_2_um_filter_33_13]|nr:MAG: hypothetical protein COY27_05450 [Candidatus Woesearchaeota archaeon CG_4_10_14_0_2_um_filter_33_13]
MNFNIKIGGSIAFFLVGGIIFFTLFSSLSLSSSEADSNNLTLTAAIPRHFPIQYWVDEQDQPTGLAIDMMDNIANLTGIKVNYLIKDNWVDTIEALTTGEADLIPNLGITPEREQVFDFTSPVETFPISIFVRSTQNDIKNLEDLNGRKVAVVETNAVVNILNQFQDVQLIVFKDHIPALFSLLSGDVDAFVYPEPVIISVAEEMTILNKIKVVGEPVQEIKRGIAVKKGNELLSVLQPAVNKFVVSKEYQDIYQKYYSPSPGILTIKLVMLVAGAVIFVLVLGFFFWRYYELKTIISKKDKAENSLKESRANLKKTVEDRTKELKQRVGELEQSKKEMNIANKLLQSKVEEIEKTNQLMVNRELKMAELKKRLQSVKKANKAKSDNSKITIR